MKTPAFLPSADRKLLLWPLVTALVFAAIVLKDGLFLPRSGILFGFLAFSAAAFLLFRGKPEIFTYMLLVYLPFSKLLLGEEQMRPMTMILNFLMTAAALAISVFGTAGERRWKRTPLDAGIAALAALQIFSILKNFLYGTEYLWAAVTYWLGAWGTPLLLFYLVYRTCDTQARRQTVVLLLVLIVTIAGLMTNYEYYDTYARVKGLASEPNMSASFFVLTMFLPLALFTLDPKWTPGWVMPVPFLLCLKALAATFSRGGYLSFALGVQVFMFLRKRLLFFVTLALLAFVIVTPSLLPEAVNKRIGETFRLKTFSMEKVVSRDVTLDASSENRIHVWRGALRLIRQYPLTGVGFHFFETRVMGYWRGATPFNAHNGYLMIAAESGIPALFFFFFILWQMVKASWRVYASSGDYYGKALALGLMSGLPAFLSANMFISSFDWQEVAFSLWVMAALCIRYFQELPLPAAAPAARQKERLPAEGGPT